ncbi:DnaJ family domain-containing protein [Nocardioides ultimimeridianus]
MAADAEEDRPLDPQAERKAARARIDQQHTWVELQVRRAIERGEFDDLPGAGKPIEGLGEEHDPDWWVKRLIERERIVVLPPAIQLRKDDAALDERLDRLWSEAEVRREVESFNARVVRARLAPGDWPPLVTQPRDVDATVAAWQERRSRRTSPAPEAPRRKRRWRRS